MNSTDIFGSEVVGASEDVKKRARGPVSGPVVLATACPVEAPPRHGADISRVVTPLLTGFDAEGGGQLVPRLGLGGKVIPGAFAQSAPGFCSWCNPGRPLNPDMNESTGMCADCLAQTEADLLERKWRENK